jgi:hypothetical protein
MFAARVRRLGMLTLGLAVALGPIVHAGAAMQSNMEMSALADSDMAMPEGCALCGDDAGSMNASACFVNCAAPAAILAAVISPVFAAGRTVVALAETAVAERHRPPDPYPPKSIAVI